MALCLPIGAALLIPNQLPVCDSAEVKQLLVEIVRDTPDFKQGIRHLRTIDGHRETHFDAQKQVRTGTCTIRTDTACHFP